jgi:transposase-like protein
MNIDDITIDDRCQPRAGELDGGLILDYAEAMQAGATFPPVTIFHDGDAYYLADGFHRIEAARIAGRNEIAADCHEGGLRDAILHAVGANSTHGKRRTNADKRQAVQTLIDDSEWSQLSDREIARQCGVTHPFVARIRGERSGNGYHLAASAARIHTLIGDLNRIGQEQVEHLDQVKNILTPDQYRAWIEQEFGISEEAEARLRQSVSDANPNTYLDFCFDRMIETVPAD